MFIHAGETWADKPGCATGHHHLLTAACSLLSLRGAGEAALTGCKGDMGGLPWASFVWVSSPPVGASRVQIVGAQQLDALTDAAIFFIFAEYL
jgi:hypothetical protein